MSAIIRYTKFLYPLQVEQMDRILSLENLSNDVLLHPASIDRTACVSDDSEDDILSLQPAQRKGINLYVQKLLKRRKETGFVNIFSCRHLKKIYQKRTDSFCSICLGEDVCIKKASTGPGIMLDKSQSDILDQSWRIGAPGRLSA